MTYRLSLWWIVQWYRIYKKRLLLRWINHFNWPVDMWLSMWFFWRHSIVTSQLRNCLTGHSIVTSKWKSQPTCAMSGLWRSSNLPLLTLKNYIPDSSPSSLKDLNMMHQQFQIKLKQIGRVCIWYHYQHKIIGCCKRATNNPKSIMFC